MWKCRDFKFGSAGAMAPYTLFISESTVNGYIKLYPFFAYFIREKRQNLCA